MNQITDNILEHLNNLIVVSNGDGRIEYVSPSVKNILGFEPAELMGDQWWKLTSDEKNEAPDLKRKILSTLGEKGGVAVNSSYERELMTSSGGKKWILWNSYRSDDNLIVGIGYDITERKQAEKMLEKRNLELDQKNKDIIGSIEYARQIQQAILPYDKKLKELVPDAFIYYSPKDLVSGDFYWFHKKGDVVYVAAIDCTGHGVPGALMSVIANSLIRDIVIKRGVGSPAEILKLMDIELEEAMSKEGHVASSDGMDVALCRFNQSEGVVDFAGAFRPLVRVRNDELAEFKGQRYPIGFYYGVEKKFENTRIPLEKGDAFYMFSDGYIDQFGGEKGKKFNKKRFKQLLLSVQEMNMEEQQSFLEYAFKNWKQDDEQVDDVLVMGIKV